MVELFTGRRLLLAEVMLVGSGGGEPAKDGMGLEKSGSSSSSSSSNRSSVESGPGSATEAAAVVACRA